jgi:hypothetical protein
VHFFEKRMNMLRALRNFGRRIIGQPIVPRMQSGVAAADRIILIAPGVVIVRQFVQRRDPRIRILIFKGLFVYRRRRFRDQRLIRNVRGSLNGRLRINAAECEKKQSKKTKKTINGIHSVILINEVESESETREALERYTDFSLGFPSRPAVAA